MSYKDAMELTASERLFMYIEMGELCGGKDYNPKTGLWGTKPTMPM
jgi:hypothetical protein